MVDDYSASGNLRGNALFAINLWLQEKDRPAGRSFFVRQNSDCHRLSLVNIGGSNNLFINFDMVGYL